MYAAHKGGGLQEDIIPQNPTVKNEAARLLLVAMVFLCVRKTKMNRRSTASLDPFSDLDTCTLDTFSNLELCLGGVH